MNGLPKTLRPALLVVQIEEVGWEVTFAGGFSGSTVVDRRFAIRTNRDGQDVLVREREKEDSTSLGLVAFAHIFKENVSPSFALTFGLGLQEKGDASYYLGLTYRFADKAALSAGAVWASRAALPAGAVLGEVPPTENVLGSLDSKIEQGWFVGVSFGLIDVKKVFQKGFK